MPILNLENLRRYRDLGYNVLLEGEAGVGKTAMILEAFKGLNTKYLSAPTLDPWVDFVGVPRPTTDPQLGDVLELVRPRFIVEDTVEALFIDELNRAPDKVLNAVMELIQFRSINGHKLTNLKVIWASINPEDADGAYTVGRLDKALRDRFHVQIQVPYEVDTAYFETKYPEIGAAICGWWHGLTDQVRKKVSPRRLDYVAHAYMNGCALSDFLPEEANVRALAASLKQVDFHEHLRSITEASSAKRFLASVNNATKLLQLINKGDPAAIEFYQRFGKVMPKEIVEALAPVITVVEQGLRPTSLAVLLTEVKTSKVSDLTRLLNECGFAYPNGGSLAEEVRHQLHAKDPAFTKLTNHILSVLSTATKADLVRAMYTDATMTHRSNLTTLAMTIVVEDRTEQVWTKAQRKKISNHTYVHGVVGAKWMI